MGQLPLLCFCFDSLPLAGPHVILSSFDIILNDKNYTIQNSKFHGSKSKIKARIKGDQNEIV